MLTSIKTMLQAFDDCGIRYCHWKSNEHLLPALDGETDLDVLFSPRQRVQLEAVLANCGLKPFRSAALMQYNAIEDYIGFDRETGRIWHLHTHFRMTLGEKHLKGYTITPWTELLLNNRRRGEENVWCSAFEDELVLLMVRIALKLRWRDAGRKLGQDDRTELNWLRERADSEKLRARAEVLLGAAAAEIVCALAKESLTEKNQLVRLQGVLRRQFRCYTGYSRMGSWFTRTRREVFWLFGGVLRRLGMNNYQASRRVSPAGGNAVTFLGCDGAGKSTILKAVKAELNKKLDVVSIYFGSGDGASSLLRVPMRLVAKRVGGKGLGHAVAKEYAGEKKKVSLKARLYSAAKLIWAVSLAAEKRSKLRAMTRARNNGLIVLTDRYPQSIVPGCSDGPLLSRYLDGKGFFRRIALWEQKIYESADRNAPDLVIKLVVPTEIALQRKPEMTAEEIEQKKQIVMQMALSENTVLLDTSRPFEKTFAEGMAAIWELL